MLSKRKRLRSIFCILYGKVPVLKQQAVSGKVVLSLDSVWSIVWNKILESIRSNVPKRMEFSSVVCHSKFFKLSKYMSPMLRTKDGFDKLF
jgi:hypothetical protein